MIIISALLLLWLVFVVGYVSTALLRPPHGANYDTDTVVTEIGVVVDGVDHPAAEVVQTTFSHAVPLLAMVLAHPANDAIRTAVARKISGGYGNELCFVRIGYQHHGQPHTCLYPMATITTTAAYPPQSMFRVDADHIVHRAALTVRYGKRSTASADVTPLLQAIQGPHNDFHMSTGAGFQLRKRLLAALVGGEIRRMLDVLTKEYLQTNTDAHFVARPRVTKKLVIRLDGRVAPIVITLD
jgi:hypothetical protein